MKKLSDKARMYARSYGQPPYGREIEGTAELFLQMAEKLEEYEDLEEQGKLLKLPCVLGDTVYVIPSKTNYKLNILNGHGENNRVYKQVVNRIEVSKNGYLFSTCDGMASVTDVFYKETWFLTQEEAEAALKKMEGQ